MWGVHELFSPLIPHSLLLGFLIVLLLLLRDLQSRKRGPRFPGGPTGVPILGNILQIDFRNLHTSLNQMCKKHGNIYSLHLFRTKVVIFNGFEVVKEVLINRSEEIADRPPFPLLERLGQKTGARGLIMIEYGNSWKEQRRFALSTLRNFGMGKKSLEERVVEEAQCLSAVFRSHTGRPFDPHYLINNAVSNVICSLAFGDRFEYSDAHFLRLLHLQDESLKSASELLPQVLNGFPWLGRIPGVAEYVLRAPLKLMAFVKEIVAEHKKSFDPNNIRDYIDAYLSEIERVKGDANTSFNETNLLMTTNDLFGAGTETTSTTLRWALLYMVLHQDIQAKVQQEIDRVIGRERKPTMEDLQEMPYTNAVIHEIQRCGDISPLALPHMTYRDMEIQGYYLPKGTTVFLNLSSVLKDEQVWEKPHQFHPGHFLGENGEFVKREAFIPFSAGRRVCLGEKLARMELFLFFTTLMQQFTFEIPSKSPRPREDAIYAFTLSPHPYEICAVPRV